MNAASLGSPGSFDVGTRTLRQSIHTWLVQRGGHTILIDTASGNDKERPTIPPIDHLNVPYLGAGFLFDSEAPPDESQKP